MSYKNLLFEAKDGLARITFNRPEKLNAFNDVLLNELEAVLHEIQTDDATRVVMLTGAGDKAFVAGADIGELARLDPAGARRAALKGQRVFNHVEGLGKPTIAVINGYALGGGCELALACTLRIASDQAKLGQPEVKLGIIPGYGGSQRLPRIVGQGRALEMILTGEPIDAAEAYRIGLVNKVVPRERLFGEAESLARKIISVGPIAVKYAVDAVVRGVEVALPEALKLEADLFGLCFATEDMREGTRAFLEKRFPKFVGR